jgi:hypothetical protein
MSWCIHQARNSDVVEPPASLVPSKGQNHQTVLQIEGQNHQTVLQIDLKNYKRTHNGPADGFNQKVKIYHLNNASYSYVYYN